MNIPKDPIMLASVLNTKLRDLYPSLEALCDREDISKVELEDALSAAGLKYNSETNRVD